MSQNPRSSFLRRWASRVARPVQSSSSSSSSSASGEGGTQRDKEDTSVLSGIGGRAYILKSPKVGPIIGTCGAYEIRIFLAAPQHEAREAVAKGGLVVGAAKLSSANTDTIAPVTATLRPEFDYTGVLAFTKLTPNTEYRLKCGWYIVSAKDRGKDKEKLKGTLNFKESAKTTFTTASIDPKESRSFVFGSCRYLFKLHTRKDISMFDGRGDKTFRSIVKQIDDGMKTDAVLMLGDQIYGDDLNVLHFDDELWEFVARYRDAFSQYYIKQLMMRVPTSMTLDDHDTGYNDFPRGVDKREMDGRFVAAIHAFQIYQVSHSTLFPINEKRGSIQGTPTRYWYTFSNGCCDWFMMDVRTERRLPDEGRGVTRIISQEQMDAVKEWLKDGAGTKVKFVVSSVPVYPVVRNSKDKWSGFPKQKAELLEYIFENRIPKVVFLSGDIHNSVSMELQSDGHKIHCIVSSPFFWPIPTHLASEFITSGEFKLINGRVLSTVSTSKVICESNFTRVDASPRGLTVRIFGRKGDLLDTAEYEYDDMKNDSA